MIYILILGRKAVNREMERFSNNGLMNFFGYHTVVCSEEGSVAVVFFLHKDQKEEDLMDHSQVYLYYPLTNIHTTRHLVKMVYLDLMRQM